MDMQNVVKTSNMYFLIKNKIKLQ